MKFFLVILFSLITFPIQAEEIPFENLQIHDPLPDYVYFLDRNVYIQWVKLQNQGAYTQAKELASKNQERTYVWDDTIKRGRYLQYEGKFISSAYMNQMYGGGPVILINPYVPRPAKVLKYKGMPYLVDPDHTIKTIEEERRLLNGN